MAAWQGVRDAVIKERQVRYTDRGEVETEAIHFIKKDGGGSSIGSRAKPLRAKRFCAGMAQHTGPL